MSLITIRELLLRGLTTNTGMNAQGVILLALAIVSEMEPGAAKSVMLATALIIWCLVSFLTRGHEAIQPGAPDVPQDDPDLDDELSDSLRGLSVFEELSVNAGLDSSIQNYFQFAGVTPESVVKRFPVGTSPAGISLIKRFEGFRSKAYLCPAGKWTIGYGHTAGVKQGMVISEAEGEAILRKDLAIFERFLSDALGETATSQNQWDAMLSLLYNIGPANFRRSSVLRNHLKRRLPEAANSFLLWNKGGGRVLAGLVKRRQAERQLYIG